MNSWLSNLIEQLRALPPTRQLTLVGAAAGSVAFFAWLMLGAASPDYRALYRGLAEAEVARVADALDAEKISYRLGDGGTAVLVPSEMLYEARIRVAGRGLPSGGGSGFEIFDRPAFGVTDFVHRVNYTRALQGELARSIEQLEPVERARVQVVIPERRSVLAARDEQARAAVIVRLRPGHELRRDQVRAVVHLVASSIESLETGQVTVVDGSGRLLAPVGEEGTGGALPVGGAPAFQQRVERELARRIESILEKTVGPGSVVARVRADMDWTESETTEEIFDPDSQVARSEQRTTETTNDGSLSAEGVPGVVSNSPDALAAAEPMGSGSSESSRTSETINFEISKKVRRQVTPMGRIERLSIAVLVAEPTAESGDGGTQAWDPESLALFESLARQAVGFSEGRGDQITVSSAPFRVPDPDLEEGAPLDPGWMVLGTTVARGLAVLLALFLFARLVVRPALGALAQTPSPGLPARVSELEAQLAGFGTGAGAGAVVNEGASPALPARSLAQQIGASTANRTGEGVKTLRNWLNQG